MKTNSKTKKDKTKSNVPDKMKIFNLIALHIFDRLYEAFPLPTEIIPKSISAELGAVDASSDEAFELISIADNTLRWLEAEGFLRHSSSGFEGGIFYQVQLSLKGLTVLNWVPHSVIKNEEPEAVIIKIKRVLSAGLTKADDESVKSVLDEVLKIAFNASHSDVSSRH
jgi:hypothetical protein